MLLRLFRKIYKNKWMFFCLLVGVTLAVAMICSIPIYTRGNLQRLLSYDMENYNKSHEDNLSSIGVTQSLDKRTINQSRNYLETSNTDAIALEKNLGVPILSKKMVMVISQLNLNETKKRYINGSKYDLEAVKDFEKYITIIDGKMYSNKKSTDNVYEVIVSQKTYQNLSLKMNKIYYLYNERNNDADIPIKIAGVYEPKNPKDSYWTGGTWKADDQRFLMDYSLFSGNFLKSSGSGDSKQSNKGAQNGKENETAAENKDLSADTLIWDYRIDYKRIKFYNYKAIGESINNIQSTWGKNGDVLINAPIKGLLDQYAQKEEKQRGILWVIQAPIFIMLIFYISMVANLILEEEKNEIALLQSRGVGRGKILLSYFLESLMVSIVALILGPLLGIFICKVLGVTSGFLNFTNRRAIDSILSINDYYYSLIGIGVFIITMMLPAIVASRKTIVLHKQGKARGLGKPFWQKYYLDVIMILISIYGLKSYKLRQQILKITSVKAIDIPVDPLIYLITTLFIVGAGLFFLRIYPYIIRGIFKIGKKSWSPSGYISLVNVGRGREKNNFIMMFLILTISISIFNIKAARTMNSRKDNNIRYLAGADVVLRGQWKQILSNDASSSKSDSGYKKPVFFEEPPYPLFSNLKGAMSTTKVFAKKNASITDEGGSIKGSVYLMGIITNEFGKTAWFDTNLLQYHWYSYLNLISKNPKAVLLSEECRTNFGLKEGDKIQVKWTVTNSQGNPIAENGPIDFIVYGFVNYWPTCNPKDDSTKYLVVANLQYLQDKLPIDKYEVWIKKDSNSSSTKALYDDIKNNKLPLEKFQDVDKKLAEERDITGIQSINAAFNLSFLANIIITVLGFIIYWILSIKGRILQFGILRSMGVTMRKIIRMLFYEQLLITMAAAAAAIGIGNLTCSLFLKLLDIVTDANQQILPFKIITFTNDFAKLALILLSLFISVIMILAVYVYKIKMDQAVKLGED